MNTETPRSRSNVTSNLTVHFSGRKTGMYISCRGNTQLRLTCMGMMHACTLRTQHAVSLQNDFNVSCVCVCDHCAVSGCVEWLIITCNKPDMSESHLLEPLESEMGRHWVSMHIFQPRTHPVSWGGGTERTIWLHVVPFYLSSGIGYQMLFHGLVSHSRIAMPIWMYI